ncbi:unnamed protein product, partial [Linum tenue]
YFHHFWVLSKKGCTELITGTVTVTVTVAATPRLRLFFLHHLQATSMRSCKISLPTPRKRNGLVAFRSLGLITPPLSTFLPSDMGDPKEAENDTADNAAPVADGVLNPNLENAALDDQQSDSQLPNENKGAELSGLDAAGAVMGVETFNCTADNPQPAPGIIELAPVADDPNDANNPHCSPKADIMPSAAAAAPEPTSGDKEYPIHFAACTEPPANGSLDDTGEVSTLKRKADNEDANFKSRCPDSNGADDGIIVANDQKPFSTTKHEEDTVSTVADHQSAENKDDHVGDRVSLLTEELAKVDFPVHSIIKKEPAKSKLDEEEPGGALRNLGRTFLLERSSDEGYESGTEEEQLEFMKEVEMFYRDNHLEFKAPKFYKEELNLLKLWRAVVKLGGYEQVTSCKLWRQVGESFRPPNGFLSKIVLESAFFSSFRHCLNMRSIKCVMVNFLSLMVYQLRQQGPKTSLQSSGSLGGLVPGRAPRRDAAARAMQGWHSQRLLGNGEVSQPVIKDKTLNSIPKADKPLKTNGLLKRKKLSSAERAISASPLKTMRTQLVVIDVGPPAEWVKVNVQRTNDCYEVYALVPGLLREEVHVQSDAAGRLVISGQPEQLENPWGVTPFKKVVSLPSRIDPHQTSAVVTLHGQLFVRVPFEQSDG